MAADEAVVFFKNSENPKLLTTGLLLFLNWKRYCVSFTSDCVSLPQIHFGIEGLN